MRCSDINELLSAYANGELSRTQREFVEEHLSSCADCRAALADYTGVQQYLTSPRATPVMPDISEAVMSKIKAADTVKKPIQRWRRPALIAAPILALLVALTVLHPWSASLSPKAIIAEAHAATMGLQSYRMIGSTTSTFEGTTLESTFEMEFAAPNRYYGRTTIDGELYEFIVIGHKQYNREPDSSRLVISKIIVVVLGSPPSKEETLELLSLLTDLEQLPDEKIEGIDCLHYRGRIDMDQVLEEQKAKVDRAQLGYQEMLRALKLQPKMKIEIELWISKDDHLIRQMKRDMQIAVMEPVSGGVAQEKWDTVNSMVKYYDFNKPIEIEPPEAASGELEPGWRLGD